MIGSLNLESQEAVLVTEAHAVEILQGKNSVIDMKCSIMRWIPRVIPRVVAHEHSCCLSLSRVV